MGIGDIGFLQSNPIDALTGGAQSGLNIGAGIQGLINANQDRQRQEQARQLFGQATGSALAGVDPNLFVTQQNVQAQQAQQEQAEKQRILESLARDAKTALDIKDPAQRNQFLGLRAQRIISNNDDPSDTLELMKLPFELQNFELQDALNQVADISMGGIPADQRSFENLISGFSDQDKAVAKRIKAGLSPRATGSAAQTIAGSGTVEAVSDVESRIAEKKAAGKAKGEAGQSSIVAAAKAEIAKAVQKATASAKSEGDTLSELKKAEASLPGLQSVVAQLKELSPIATSTLGGNVFDMAVKETGFGSTKGATAKAKFSSIINNQILPLLKQTFGAAFTKAEGDELKATMGNVDASPEEKLAQLDAFIEGKYREIQTKQRELGRDVTPSSELAGKEGGEIMIDANGNRALVYPDGTFEEL